jgi:hypothetical protein
MPLSHQEPGSFVIHLRRVQKVVGSNPTVRLQKPSGRGGSGVSAYPESLPTQSTRHAEISRGMVDTFPVIRGPILLVTG